MEELAVQLKGTEQGRQATDMSWWKLVGWWSVDHE